VVEEPARPARGRVPALLRPRPARTECRNEHTQWS
jgi:hypothetical protein